MKKVSSEIAALATVVNIVLLVSMQIVPTSTPEGITGVIALSLVALAAFLLNESSAYKWVVAMLLQALVIGIYHGSATAQFYYGYGVACAIQGWAAINMWHAVIGSYKAHRQALGY